MATQSFTITSFNFGTAAGIQSQGAQISTALQATGLTKTTDTGQIDWTTTTTGVGYEIYRFNDTLQATNPLYLRVQFTAGTNSWQYITSMTLGTGTNGAGTLTGTTTPASGYAGTATNVATGTGSWTWRFNYNATLGFFGLTQWDNLAEASSSSRGVFCVSRSCDTTGTPVGSGVLIQSFGAASGNPAPTTSFLSYDTGTAVTMPDHATPGYGTYSTLTIGTTVQFLRQTVAFPTLRTIPQVLYYAAADVTKGTTVTLSPNSTSYTYITCGSVGYATADAKAGYAMLWQ